MRHMHWLVIAAPCMALVLCVQSFSYCQEEAVAAGATTKSESGSWADQLLEKVEKAYEKAKTYFENKDYEKASEAVQGLADALSSYIEKFPAQLKGAASTIKDKMAALCEEIKQGKPEAWSKVQYYVEKLRLMLNVSYNFLLVEKDYEAGDGESAATRMEKIKEFMAKAAKESGQEAEAIWKVGSERFDHIIDRVRNSALRNVRQLQMVKYSLSRQIGVEYRLAKAEVYIEDKDYQKAIQQLNIAVMYLESGEEMQVPPRFAQMTEGVPEQLKGLVSDLAKGDKEPGEYIKKLQEVRAKFNMSARR